MPNANPTKIHQPEPNNPEADMLLACAGEALDSGDPEAVAGAEAIIGDLEGAELNTKPDALEGRSLRSLAILKGRIPAEGNAAAPTLALVGGRR